MASTCQVPTPIEYVSLMLDYAGYKDNLYGKHVLENSCGEGNILVGIVERYILSAIKEEIDKCKIVEGLERDIVAFDTDENCIKKCIDRLNAISSKYELSGISWNIQHKDYLHCGDSKYDFIIGNPPYITYHNLTKTQRKDLQNHFSSCEKGRFDYCYAFIEKCLQEMNENAKMVYLVPYSVVRNKFSSKLREIILPRLEAIYDFQGIKIFPNRVTSSVIISCGNSNDYKVLYRNIIEKKDSYLLKESLKNSWIFDKKKCGKFRFGDHFKVGNSIATLCNKIFLFEEYTVIGDSYVFKDGEVEATLVYDAISVKSQKKKAKTGVQPKIIFPYKVIKHDVERIKEKEFRKNFPKTYHYLFTKKKQLENRNLSDGISWFEYGRSQAIAEIFCPKLIIPMILTNNVVVFMADENTIPYAGYYIKCRQDTKFTLEVAKEILESKEFYEYVKQCGTPTTTTSYRISVKDISNYTFDL